MRRAVPVIAATTGGLALLASFHTTPSASTVATGPPSGSSSEASSASSSTTTTSRGSGSRTTTSTTTPAGRRTVDGPVVRTDYGDVQVQVTLQGHQIVDVHALQLPVDRSRSAQISRYAEPLLRKEALQAQSANIDLVSGASYTSDGYAQSLQGALDSANK